MSIQLKKKCRSNIVKHAQIHKHIQSKLRQLNFLNWVPGPRSTVQIQKIKNPKQKTSNQNHNSVKNL